MIIYLAGPTVFKENAIECFKEMKATAKSFGVEALSPFDNEPKRNGKSPESWAHEIYENNIELIKKCDAIVADITPFRGPSADIGTAFELGYGASLGKQLHAYTGVSSQYKERAKGDLIHPAVEDFDLIDNLMIICPLKSISSTFEGALKTSILYHKCSK